MCGRTFNNHSEPIFHIQMTSYTNRTTARSISTNVRRVYDRLCRILNTAVSKFKRHTQFLKDSSLTVIACVKKIPLGISTKKDGNTEHFHTVL